MRWAMWNPNRVSTMGVAAPGCAAAMASSKGFRNVPRENVPM